MSQLCRYARCQEAATPVTALTMDEDGDSGDILYLGRTVRRSAFFSICSPHTKAAWIGSLSVTMTAMSQRYLTNSNGTRMQVSQRRPHERTQQDIIVDPPKPYVYERPRLGWHPATITEVEDLGIVQNDLYGSCHRVKIHVRLEDEKHSLGWPKYVTHNCTLNSSPRARLGKFLRQLELPTDQPVGLRQLEGMSIYAEIVYSVYERHDETFANIRKVRPRGER